MRYFDTSFLVPTLVAEPTSPAIVAFFAHLLPGDWAISHWVRVEFSALLARSVRSHRISAQEAAEWDAAFEAVARRSFIVLLPDVADFSLAKSLVGAHGTSLRAPDALHLAIAKNHRATGFYSLDKRLLEAARSLGLVVNGGVDLPGYPG